MHVTVSSQSQNEKALLPILVSDLGNSIAVSLQLENASWPIVVTDSGSVTVVKEVQPLNALLLISFIPDGMVTEDNDEQFIKAIGCK